MSEIIGSEPLEEEILETTLDARHRLLKPDARLIPDSLCLLARPLRIPDADVRQRSIGHAAVSAGGASTESTSSRSWTRRRRDPSTSPPKGRWPHRGDRWAHPLSSPGWITRFERATVCALGRHLVVDGEQEVNAVAVTFRTSLRRYRAHPGPLALAGIQLGNFGLGATGPGTRRRRNDAATGLPSPSPRRTGRPHLSSGPARND